MSPLKQRIAILEYMGWSNLIKVSDRHALKGTSPEGRENQYAPNPLVNLNVMQEAENLLTYADQNDYLIWLIGHPKKLDNWGVVNVGCRERGESFVKTINKWKDE